MDGLDTPVSQSVLQHHLSSFGPASRGAHIREEFSDEPSAVHVVARVFEHTAVHLAIRIQLWLNVTPPIRTSGPVHVLRYRTAAYDRVSDLGGFLGQNSANASTATTLKARASAAITPTTATWP